MTDDLRKDLLAIVLEEAFGYDEARIRNWLAGRKTRGVCNFLQKGAIPGRGGDAAMLRVENS